MQFPSAKHHVDAEPYFQLAARASSICVKNQIRRYPINPIRLANNYDIRVVSYDRLHSLSGNSIAELLAISEDGFSLYMDGVYLIAYNLNVNSKGRRRWTLLHELSHILLEHVSGTQPRLEDLSNRAHMEMEQEADSLASCLIAPLGVAHFCNVQSAEEMRAVFGLSREAAGYIYRDLCALRANGHIDQLIFQDSICLCRSFISDRLTLQYRLKNHLIRPIPNLNILCDESYPDTAVLR